MSHVDTKAMPPILEEKFNLLTGRNIVWVVRAALPWLMILLLFLVIITYVPQVSLFLP